MIALRMAAGKHSFEGVGCPGYAFAHGGVPERSNGMVLKIIEPFAGLRGFKSHPRR